VREFLYIVCYYHDDTPSFVHTRLCANDVDDAYTQGGKWADVWLVDFKGKLINDYVIEVSQ
jgi:hypothetical protein